MLKWILINVARFHRKIENFVGITKLFRDIVKAARIQHIISKKVKNLVLVFEKQDENFRKIHGFFIRKPFFFCLSLNFLNIMLTLDQIRLTYS